MNNDLATAAREVGESLGSTVRATKTAKLAPTKQQQLARLIVEIGIDAAQVVFHQVRVRLEKIA